MVVTLASSGATEIPAKLVPWQPRAIRRSRLSAWAGASLLLCIVSVDAFRKQFVGSSVAPLAIVPISCALYGGAYLISRRRAAMDKSAPYLFGISAALGIVAMTSALTNWLGLQPFLAGLQAYILYTFIGLAVPRALSEARIERLRWLSGAAIVIGVVVAISSLGSLWTNLGVFSPIIERAGVHSFKAGDISLHPGVFATGERLSRVVLFPLMAAITYSVFHKGRRPAGWIAVAIMLVGILLSGRRFALLLAIMGGAIIIAATVGVRRSRRLWIFVAGAACITALFLSEAPSA
jgi:hypothetical protein